MRTQLSGALAVSALTGLIAVGAGTFAFADEGGGFGSLHGGFTHPRMYNRDARFSHPSGQAGSVASVGVRSLARMEALKSGLQPVSQTAPKQIASDTGQQEARPHRGQ